MYLIRLQHAALVDCNENGSLLFEFYLQFWDGFSQGFRLAYPKWHKYSY